MKPFKIQFILIIPFIVLAVGCGIWGGWIRLGWSLPLTAAAGRHGAIMVGSFLGTLICMDRASVSRIRWAWIVPLINGCSIIFFLLRMDIVAFSLLCFGSFGLVLMVGSLLLKDEYFYLKIMLTGSICWLTGNIILLVYNSYIMAVAWWIGFLLLTIIAGRLENTSFFSASRNKNYLLGLSVTLFILGLVIPFHLYGRYISGFGMVLTSLWFIKNDEEAKLLKKKGIPRYTAVLLLAGYTWLLICGLTMVIGNWYGFMYDAALHAFFIGFGFSMIFTQGPNYIGGLVNYKIKPFSSHLYIWAILLQTSLVTRFTAGLLELNDWRMWSGILNGIAIICFFIHLGFLSRKEVKKLREKREVRY